MKKLLIGLAAFLFLLDPALAQKPVSQSGNITPGHAVRWITNGVVGDGGTAVNGFLTSIGVMASGPGICQNSGPITGPYNEICLGVTSSGGQITFKNAGGATGPLTLTINGTAYPFPFTSTNSIAGPVSTTIGDIACWNNTIGTLLSDCNSATNPLAQFYLTATDPLLTGSYWANTNAAMGTFVTSTAINLPTGFQGEEQATEIDYSYLHGDHFSGFGSGKSTVSNILTNFTGGGAGQKFGAIFNTDCPGAGDCQTVSIKNFPFGGLESSGDEGICLVCGAVFWPFTNVALTATGNGVVGGGNTTTTQVITQSATAQTVTVASSGGFTTNEWVIVNSSATDPNDAEAVQLTGVGAGTITGVFRGNQNSGVTVKPATVLAVSGTGGVGEHRYLINDSLSTYTTGTVTFDPSGVGDNTYHGSATAWTNGMVGGNSSVIGCISVATYGTTTRKYWDRITSVNSTTNLTGIQGVPGFSTPSTYVISPCAFVYRVIPNGLYGSAGTLVLENNPFTWSNGNNIEQAVGPDLGGVLMRLEDDPTATGWAASGMQSLLELDELGTFAPRFFINLVNFGVFRPISQANQTAFIRTDSSANPGQIQNIISSEQTVGLLSATIHNGGSYVADKYGWEQSGLVENANLGGRAGFELDPVWNHNSTHILFGGNVNDTLSASTSDLINLQVNSVSKFEVRKDGRITDPFFGGSGAKCINTDNSGNLGTTSCGAAIGGANTDIQFNNSGVLGGDGNFTYAGAGGVVTLTPAADTAQPFLITGGSTTAAGTSRLGLSVVGTLNTSGLVDGAALFANVTNTASSTDSPSIDIQVAATSTFKTRLADGAILMANGFGFQPNASGTIAAVLGWTAPGTVAASQNVAALIAAQLQIFNSGARGMILGRLGSGASIETASTGVWGWSSSSDAATSDTGLARNSVGVVELTRPSALTSPTSFQIYNTTDASSGAPTNYERGVLDWTTTSNVLTIGTQAGGSGTVRGWELIGGGVEVASFNVDTANSLVFNPLNQITAGVPVTFAQKNSNGIAFAVDGNRNGGAGGLVEIGFGINGNGSGGPEIFQASGTKQLVISNFGGIVFGNASLTITSGAIGLNKMTASASAPGAVGGKIELVCGTGAGSAKLIAYAGTSSTAVTILDNIGSGVTGC